MVEVLVPLGLWVMIAVISVAAIWGGVQSKRELNETARRAIDTGQPLDPDTITALMKPTRAPAQDLRGGVILTTLAIGLGLCGALFGGHGMVTIDGDVEATSASGFYIAAVIVGSLGVGRLIAAWLRRDRKAA